MNRVVLKDKVYNKTTIYSYVLKIEKDEDDLVIDYINNFGEEKRIVYQRNDIFSFDIGPMRHGEEDTDESVNP